MHATQTNVDDETVVFLGQNAAPNQRVLGVQVLQLHAVVHDGGVQGHHQRTSRERRFAAFDFSGGSLQRRLRVGTGLGGSLGISVGLSASGGGVPTSQITTVLPRCDLMNGIDSEKIRAFPIVLAIRGFP